jgi:hypothetical protein
MSNSMAVHMQIPPQGGVFAPRLGWRQRGGVHFGLGGYTSRHFPVSRVCRGLCRILLDIIVSRFCQLQSHKLEFALYYIDCLSFYEQYNCLSPHSCSELAQGASIGLDSCLGVDACRGSEAIIIQNNSCVGDKTCSFTQGFTKIDSSSCIGGSACSYLTLGTISEEACQGVGACSRPNLTQSPTTSPAFIVGSNSCNGCYAVSFRRHLISPSFWYIFYIPRASHFPAVYQHNWYVIFDQQ